MPRDHAREWLTAIGEVRGPFVSLLCVAVLFSSSADFNLRLQVTLAALFTAAGFGGLTLLVVVWFASTRDRGGP